MMGQISINLDSPIKSIKIYDETILPIKVESKKTEQVDDIALQKQKAEIASAYNALKMAIAKVNQFYGNIVARRGEEIAKLSIEIARRILAQKIETQDYEIESIIKEALKNSPSNQDVIVHLNPDDYEQCNKILIKDANTILQGVTLVADSNVGRAECIVKTTKGTIVSLINDQLEQIEKALKNTQ